ncbi:hypothetical protein [Azospirillum palustre]
MVPARPKRSHKAAAGGKDAGRTANRATKGLRFGQRAGASKICAAHSRRNPWFPYVFPKMIGRISMMKIRAAPRAAAMQHDRYSSTS